MPTKAERDKARLNSYFSGRGEGWMNPSEQAQEARANAARRIDSAVAAGALPSISEAEREDLIDQILRTGEFDLQRSEQPVLPSATPVEPEAPGYWASRMQELRNAGSVAGEIVGNPDAATYFENTLAASSAQEELSDIQADEQGGPIADFLSVAANRIGLADMVSTMTGENVEGKDIVGLYRNLGRELTAGTKGPGLAAMFTDPSTVIDNIISPQRAKERMEAEQAERDARKSAAQSKLQTATANLEGLDVGLLTEGTLGAVATAIGQPEQVLPTAGALVGGALGGPAAASAGATLLSYPMAETAYIGAKNQAKEQFGANEEEATMYGLLVASVQVGSEGVGGPLESAAVGIAKRAGLRSLTKEAAEDWLAKKIRSRTSRVLGGAAVEAGEEVAAAAGQDAIEKALEVTEFFDSPEGQEALREHNLENAATWGRRYAQQALGGFTMGGLMAAPVAHGAVRAEQSQRAAEDEAGILGNLLTEKALDRRARKEVGDEAAKADTELTQDIAFEEQRIANEQAKQQAFEQAEKAAAEQRELEEEAGFQTLERGDVSPSSRVERYADVVERVPVEPAREVRPEDVAEQRASAERAEQERQERVRQGKLAEEIRKEREKIAKAKANEEKKLTKAQKDAARKQRADVRRELVEQNPDASDLEIGEMLEQRMANMPAPEVLTDPVEQKAASALKNITTSRKRAASTAETKRMNALARKNPDATPQELAALFNGQAPQAAPVLPEAAPTQTATPAPETAQTTSPEQQERDSALEAMGITLGMARESNDTRGNGQRTVKDYMPVARRIADAISRRSDRKGRAVSGLIRQGKLVIAPNAEFVGYEEKGRAAEFDPDTGKLYIYSDHINPDQIVPAILEAVAHEGTHGTTRTPRDGRAALMQSLLGENGVAESVGKIRAAAKKGNKIAQEAVRLAEADTKQRRELGETNPARFEDEEVIAYFSGEAVANREKPLGSVAGVVRDIRTAARSFLRDKAGLDLDVDLSDLNTAAQNVLAETARTSLRPTQGDRLGMIVGPHHPAYGKAKLTYKGAVDNLDRTEIPDYQVEVDQSVLKNLDNLKATTLKEILPHKELYDGYAKQRLGDYRVAADPNLEAYARYDGKTISLNKTLIHLANTIPEAPSPFEDFSGLTNLEALRRSILHETQHAVQEIEDFVPGANPRSFIPRSYINRLERAQENYNKVITNFDLGRAVSTLTPQVRSVWNNEVLAAANLTRNGKAQLFLAQEYYEDSTDRMIQLYGPRYHEAAEALAAAREDYDIARDTAYATYLRDYGETEARNTEHRSRMTPEELAANAPEDTMGDAAGNVPVGRTLDTAQYVGGTRRPPQSASRATSSRDRGGHSLGMAARSPAQVRRSTAAVDFLVPERFEAEGQKARMVLTGLFQNAKGLNRNILTAYEHAQSSPAAEEAKANKSLGKYEEALQRLSIARNTTPEALNSQIMEELDTIDASNDSYDENRAAFKKVVDKYGEAGKHLMDLRDQVDELTLEMLKQRAKGPKPNAEEAKLLATLAANMGRYSHRLYAAHQGRAGKLYAHSVLSAYRKGQKGKTLTPRQQETYDMVERAVKTIIDDGLVIPDDMGLGEADNERISRLYHTWGDGTARDADEMRDQLADLRERINGDTDRLRTQAESILKELLDIAVMDNTSPIATYYRGAKQNRGILQERKKIPAEIRAVMGEVTDPATRLLATVAKQAEFVARTKFLLEVQEFANPMDLQPPGSAGTPEVVGNHMTKLEGESYGPLDGWYASPNLKAMLGDIRETLATFEQAVTMPPGKTEAVLAAVRPILNKWMAAAALSKRLQIVGNMFLFPLNLMGSFGPLAINGNISPTTAARGLKDATALIRYARRPSLGLGSAEDAVRYGVTDSATVGELKGLPYQKIQAFANEMAGKKMSQLWAVARRHGMAFTELYAMMDVWAKIANFHNEVKQLTDYYKKNNESRTEEQIKREAADIVNSTNITYKRALPAIKALERGAITHFGTYFYETFRSQLGNARQGIKEMTYDVARASTPEAKAEKLWRGSKRLAGQAAFWAFAGLVQSWLAQMMFGDDDDDEWDKRSLFADYMQNQDLYPVGVDANGSPIYFSVSRIDAYGPVTDIMRQARTGGLNYDQAKEEFLNLYVKPRMGPQLWKAGATILGEDRPTRDPLIKELFPNGFENILKATSAVGVSDQTTRALTNLAESVFLPGTLNAQRSYNPEIADQIPNNENDSEFQKQAKSGIATVAMISRIMGATFVKADPARQASFLKMDYDDTVRNARKDLAELFDDRPGVTQEEIVEKILDGQEAEHKQWNELARVYRGMRASDMSQSDINKALKDAQITGELLSQIKRQKFTPTIVSKKSFESYLPRQLRGKTAAERKEIERNWNEAWKRLNQAEESIK